MGFHYLVFGSDSPLVQEKPGSEPVRSVGLPWPKTLVFILPLSRQFGVEQTVGNVDADLKQSVFLLWQNKSAHSLQWILKHQVSVLKGDIWTFLHL